jgi:glutamate--cysteine ligase
VGNTDFVIDRAAAEGYVAKVCFKTGPPHGAADASTRAVGAEPAERLAGAEALERLAGAELPERLVGAEPLERLVGAELPERLVGAELEWIVCYQDDPGRPIDRDVLIAALDDHAPRTLRADSPQLPLPHGGAVTVEPGGQVEISTPARASLAELLATTEADAVRLRDLLANAGLVPGDHGYDARRPPHRILDTPRYAAMEHAYDRDGPAGRVMMGSTASVQVCVDIGVADRIVPRWRAVHAVGPPLLAAFANSPGRDGEGWASERMRTWFALDPALLTPPPDDPDPATAFAARAVCAPLLCVRRGDGDWTAPAGATFADWIAGRLPGVHRPPTYDDLDYHLSTLFPLVRPRGYLEVRYLDAQPGGDWIAPVALLAALFASEEAVDEALALALPVADRWLPAARDGLADPPLARVAADLIDLGRAALSGTDLDPATIAAVTRIAEHRMARLSKGAAR